MEALWKQMGAGSTSALTWLHRRGRQGKMKAKARKLGT
jgi:hypothetical protein